MNTATIGKHLKEQEKADQIAASLNEKVQRAFKGKKTLYMTAGNAIAIFGTHPAHEKPPALC